MALEPGRYLLPVQSNGGTNCRQMSTKFLSAEKSWGFNASKQYLAQIKRETIETFMNTDFNFREYRFQLS